MTITLHTRAGEAIGVALWGDDFAEVASSRDEDGNALMIGDRIVSVGGRAAGSSTQAARLLRDADGIVLIQIQRPSLANIDRAISESLQHAAVHSDDQRQLEDALAQSLQPFPAAINARGVGIH